MKPIVTTDLEDRLAEKTGVLLEIMIEKAIQYLKTEAYEVREIVQEGSKVRYKLAPCINLDTFKALFDEVRQFEAKQRLKYRKEAEQGEKSERKWTKVTEDDLNAEIERIVKDL